MSEEKKMMIRSKDRDAILQSLRAGVTPKNGLQYIQVGRVKEVEALITDIDRIMDGGAAFRLVIGEYGSGKSFFLQLVRAIALKKGLVTLQADLSPDRRLYSTSGHARNLYAELTRNCATRAKPDGQALASVVERFITLAREEAKSQNCEVSDVIGTRLAHLSELVGGYDFAQVIEAYWIGFDNDNEVLKQNSLRWLRGEFATKKEARDALGVRSIVDDSNVYDRLKLLSLFVKQAGYNGLLICLDEMVNLFKLHQKQSRTNNYEQILRMLNDCLQGTSDSMGFVMGGTPEFLTHPTKGLYSYQALQSRLADNRFAKTAGVTDYTTPVLHLVNLSPEELLVLLHNLRKVFASGDESRYLVPDEALSAFLTHCFKNVGEAYFRTPRTTIKAFIDFLSVLEQNPSLDWKTLLPSLKIEEERLSGVPLEKATSSMTKAQAPKANETINPRPEVIERKMDKAPSETEKIDDDLEMMSTLEF